VIEQKPLKKGLKDRFLAVFVFLAADFHFKQ
jgi:hypothetical protein